jgi:uncharacterized protein YegJ (DUF2314 family)
MTYVAPDDPAMTKAIEEARSTLGKFIAAVEAPTKNQSQFSIKTPFVDGAKSEHIWLLPVTYDGKQFHGVVNNEPQDVKNVKLGDKVIIQPADVSDWMYVDDGRLVGGYTLRVLRNTLSPTERAEFDKSLPFKID